jgi:hypothetical protein
LLYIIDRLVCFSSSHSRSLCSRKHKAELAVMMPAKVLKASAALMMHTLADDAA